MEACGEVGRSPVVVGFTGPERETVPFPAAVGLLNVPPFPELIVRAS